MSSVSDHCNWTTMYKYPTTPEEKEEYPVDIHPLTFICKGGNIWKQRVMLNDHYMGLPFEGPMAP